VNMDYKKTMFDLTRRSLNIFENELEIN